jgi:membrane protease YdiL (CAAX protease family)
LIIVGFIGVAVLFGLKSLFVTESNPLAGEETLTHPIQEVLANGNVYAIVFAVMMASICAPIVEETVFRGVFYRYLRDRSVAWARWPSICVSALMNSLIFAAIHPQGWEAVPALAAIGVTLTLIRVWRGSLLGPMAAHCFHNTVLLGLSLLIMQ